MEPKYKRILLKLSGEALAGDKKSGLNYEVITDICTSIKKVTEAGAQVAIVVGGGNFWRGRSSGAMDRTRADHIGMLILYDAISGSYKPTTKTANTWMNILFWTINNRIFWNIRKKFFCFFFR